MAYRSAETVESGGPLVIAFHGTGGDGTQFHGLTGHILPDAHAISPRRCS